MISVALRSAKFISDSTEMWIIIDAEADRAFVGSLFQGYTTVTMRELSDNMISAASKVL